MACRRLGRRLQGLHNAEYSQKLILPRRPGHNECGPVLQIMSKCSSRFRTRRAARVKMSAPPARTVLPRPSSYSRFFFAAPFSFPFPHIINSRPCIQVCICAVLAVPCLPCVHGRRRPPQFRREHQIDDPLHPQSRRPGLRPLQEAQSQVRRHPALRPLCTSKTVTDLSLLAAKETTVCTSEGPKCPW